MATTKTIAKFIQYKSVANEGAKSTFSEYLFSHFVLLKQNKMRVAAKANAKRKLIFYNKRRRCACVCVWDCDCDCDWGHFKGALHKARIKRDA